jgi:hypothetical protein
MADDTAPETSQTTPEPNSKGSELPKEESKNESREESRDESAELPSELKTVHESPAPRDTPIEQQDDAPKDRQEREKLLEQAILFLETSSVRDAPLEQKREFLRSRGLTVAEADDLIAKVDGKAKGPEKQPAVLQTPPEVGIHLRGDSRPTDTPQVQQPVVSSAPQAMPQAVPQATILTYPEWLAPPPPADPRPLISGPTLVKSIYFGAATAATVFGANKLIVTPMLDSLAVARLEFSATVRKNLDELNSRLLEFAPASYLAKKDVRAPPYAADDEESVDSDASDPTELFHVDAETQTTPSLLGPDDDEAGTGAMTPDSKLEELTSQMKVLVESHSDGTDNELTFLLEDLTSYLEGLTYEASVSSNIYSTPFGGYGNQVDKDKDDSIGKVKQEIRSVKGVLLNT